MRYSCEKCKKKFEFRDIIYYCPYCGNGLAQSDKAEEEKAKREAEEAAKREAEEAAKREAAEKAKREAAQKASGESESRKAARKDGASEKRKMNIRSLRRPILTMPPRRRRNLQTEITSPWSSMLWRFFRKKRN